MAHVAPYIKFSGNCHEAFTFYHSILGGELTFQVVKDTPMGENMPPESQEKILHGALVAESYSIFGSDMADREGNINGNNVVLSYMGSGDEVRSAFEKLAVGGIVTDPITEVPFGIYGALKDKYGLRWMFQADKA